MRYRHRGIGIYGFRGIGVLGYKLRGIGVRVGVGVVRTSTGSSFQFLHCATNVIQFVLFEPFMLCVVYAAIFLLTLKTAHHDVSSSDSKPYRN